MTRLITRTATSMLPWLVLFAISASSAYGFALHTNALSSPSERIQSAAPATCDPTSERLLRYAASNSWLPAEYASQCR
jgi:hypothetical protein